MRSTSFSDYAKAKTSLPPTKVAELKHRVVAYYRAIHDRHANQNFGGIFFANLFTPPMTYAKIATYLITTILLSTGVYAGVAPDSFARTSSAVQETVSTVVSVFVPEVTPDIPSSEDVRESDDEVFCRGERRTSQECDALLLSVLSGNDEDDDSNENDDNDIRESEDEVFCDGERRDAEDCVKRANKANRGTEDELEDLLDDSDDDSNDDHGNDVRESEDEVFCDGERRDAEDCAERANKDVEDQQEALIDEKSDENSNENDDKDVRESEDEVFCDGERRDAEDCAERANKDTEDELENLLDDSNDDSNDTQGNDIGKDEGKVFCDGERRDAEDCAERANKDVEDDNEDDSENNEEEDD